MIFPVHQRLIFGIINQEFGNTTTEGKIVEGPEQKDMYRKFMHKIADFPCLLEKAEIPRCPEGWKPEGYSLKNGKKLTGEN